MTTAPTATVAPRGRSLAARAPSWLGPVAMGAAAVGACTVVGLTSDDATVGPACPFRAATGLDCPGCGGTRAVRALTQGDLGRAADHNLLFLLVLPLLVAGWALWLGRSLDLTHRRLLRWTPTTNAVVAAVLASWWVARALPFEPLSHLASGVG